MKTYRSVPTLSKICPAILAAILLLALRTPTFGQAPVDTDGDTWPDAEETALGTNPNDPTKLPEARNVDG